MQKLYIQLWHTLLKNTANYSQKQCVKEIHITSILSKKAHKSWLKLQFCRDNEHVFSITVTVQHLKITICTLLNDTR